MVKLFTPDGNATWLLQELSPNGMLFGLCDLGQGFPKIGFVNILELQTFRGKLRLPIERDRYFKANKTLLEYANEAHEKGRIIT